MNATHWEDRYAQRTARMGSSAIREILKYANRPEIISFAGGLPAPEVFPVEAFREASDRVLAQHGALALQYSTTEGYLPLREMIARHTARYNIHVDPDNVLLTNGSQQALDLIGKLFINPGDRIIVEAPTYLGAIQAWNAYGAEYIQVETDADGMRMDALEEALRSGPKFIYALPNFQNPTGTTLPLERRLRLIELADHYGVPIIEDDPYGQLRYEGEHLPTLVQLDNEFHECDNCYEGNVIYLSTFSKTLAPGIRLAWVIAPHTVIRRLVQAKQGADLHTATLNQMIAHEVARDGFLDKHIRVIREVYRGRRDEMLHTMAQRFPAGVRWTHPQGGLFLWVTLPDGLNADDLFQIALEQDVAFVPGAPFYPRGGGENTMRLNFSNASKVEIKLGIKRLARAIKQLTLQTA